MAAVGRWASPWRFWLFILVCCGPVALADYNQYFHISHLCGRKRSQQLYKKIDGAVLDAQNVNGLDCVVTFHTDSILQKFMLRFEDLKLDCNDHLFIYDGTNAYGNHTVDLSCGHNTQNVGLLYTEGNYVTLKYITDGWIQMGSGFKLVLTAIKRLPSSCVRDFRCRNGFCIDNDLKCDKVDHCSDNSDETSHAECPDSSTTTSSADDDDGHVASGHTPSVAARSESIPINYLLLHISINYLLLTMVILL